MAKKKGKNTSKRQNRERKNKAARARRQDAELRRRREQAPPPRKRPRNPEDVSFLTDLMWRSGSVANPGVYSKLEWEGKKPSLTDGVLDVEGVEIGLWWYPTPEDRARNTNGEQVSFLDISELEEEDLGDDDMELGFGRLRDAKRYAAFGTLGEVIAPATVYGQWVRRQKNGGWLPKEPPDIRQHEMIIRIYTGFVTTGNVEELRRLNPLGSEMYRAGDYNILDVGTPDNCSRYMNPVQHDRVFEFTWKFMTAFSDQRTSHRTPELCKRRLERLLEEEAEAAEALFAAGEATRQAQDRRDELRLKIEEVQREGESEVSVVRRLLEDAGQATADTEQEIGELTDRLSSVKGDALEAITDRHMTDAEPLWVEVRKLEGLLAARQETQESQRRKVSRLKVRLASGAREREEQLRVVSRTLEEQERLLEELYEKEKELNHPFYRSQLERDYILTLLANSSGQG